MGSSLYVDLKNRNKFAKSSDSWSEKDSCWGNVLSAC